MIAFCPVPLDTQRPRLTSVTIGFVDARFALEPIYFRSVDVSVRPRELDGWTGHSQAEYMMHIRFGGYFLKTSSLFT